jgi:hypothetical protein
MTNQKDAETKRFQAVLEEATPDKYLTTLDRAINELDLGVSLFQNDEVIGLGLYTQVVGSWQIANKEEALREAIKEEMEAIRKDPERIAEYNIPTDAEGDPVRQFFNPHCWAGRMTKGREEEFVMERIAPLRDFFMAVKKRFKSE